MNLRNIFFFCFILFIISCHKDEEPYEVIKTKFTAQVLQQIDGNIIGFVYDESNKPVVDAIVQIYSGETRTNKFGVFIFKNAKVDKQGTYITVRKNGYLLGSDMVYPNEKAVAYSRIGLLSLEQKVFNAADGGNINITGGGKIEFPKNAISFENGSNYNGKVLITARLLNIENPLLEELMPGGLIGQALNKETVALGSAGMIAVELRSEDGLRLNLTPGKKATLVIPTSLVNAPKTIPMWHFDENLGRWIEEGVANLRENNYVAEVSHFSFWNCDAPFPLVDICGKVVDENGNPVPNVWVSVTPEGGFWSSGGFTDNKGEFCGKMPKGVKLTFKLSSGCEVFYHFEKTLGPFNDNINLDPFVPQFDNDKNLNVKAKIECNGVAVNNSIVIVKVGDRRFTYNVENGIFENNISKILCENIASATIFAFDSNTGEASPETTIENTVSLNEIILNLCTLGCDINAAITNDCSGKLTVNVTQGRPPFTYKWNSGEMNPTIEIDSLIQGNTIYCVTITDAVGCTKSYCKEAGQKLQAKIEGYCGQAYGYYIGGVKPYTFLWSNGSTEQQQSSLSTDNYCLTVTDAVGCTAMTCKMIYEGLFVDPTPVTCNKDKFSLSSSGFSVAKIYNNNSGETSYLTTLNELSIFKTGLNFNLDLSDQICESSFQITLPQVDSLSAKVTNTSCGTCNDGFITVELLGQCYGCIFGAIRIFKEADTNTDISALNNAKALPKGFYYVVVEDKNTGCYIGLQKVEIR